MVFVVDSCGSFCIEYSIFYGKMEILKKMIWNNELRNKLQSLQLEMLGLVGKVCRGFLWSEGG